MVGRFVFVDQQNSQAELRYRLNSTIYIPSSRLNLLSLFLLYYPDRQHPDLDLTRLAQNHTSHSNTHPIGYTTLQFLSEFPSATWNYIIMLTVWM